MTEERDVDWFERGREAARAALVRAAISQRPGVVVHVAIIRGPAWSTWFLAGEPRGRDLVAFVAGWDSVVEAVS